MRDERYLKISKRIKGSIVPIVLLFAIFLFLTWLIVKPLGRPLLFSAVFSYFAYPFYARLRRSHILSNHPNIAAGMTTGAILFFMTIPMLLLGLFLTKRLLGYMTRLRQADFLTAHIPRF